MGAEMTPDRLEIPVWYLAESSINTIVSKPCGSTAAKAELLRDADVLLAQRPWSVMDKRQPPPSGDKHDYTSLAVYVWPNPDTEDGLPYIHKDGQVNPEVHDYDFPNMRNMAISVETLALAAVYGDNNSYADKAAELLRVWFLDEATCMNPHLNFGQFVPGDCDGRCYGIIETTFLIKVVNSVNLLETNKNFDYADGAQMRQWFASYAQWLSTSELGRTEAATTNNHRAWHIAQLACFLVFSGQLQSAKYLLEREVEDLLASQMADDGSFPRELARTRSFHYVSFILMALMICVRIGEQLGLDLVHMASDNGSCVAKGVTWFLPYLSGNRQWQWQQIREESPFSDIYPVLRMAGNTLGDESCEVLLKKLTGDNYEDLLTNLILPPRIKCC